MIAIIIVNWNGRRDTVECLESLMRLETDDFVAVVVDNGSSDGSVAAFEAWATDPEPPQPEGAAWRALPYCRRRRPVVAVVPPDGALDGAAPGSIVVVPAGDNLGFAGANNIGMRMARRESRVSHFFLLNNDTIVALDVLNRLSAAAEAAPDKALIGACLMYYHTPDTVQGVAGFFRPWRAGGGHIGFHLAHAQLPPVSEIEARMSYVMGAAMFLPVATYDEIGPMSEAYFLYFEELEWAYRLGRPGRQTVALDAIVYHKEGGSIGTSSLKRPSDTSLYYLYRNLVRFFRRRHPLLLPVALARILREMVRHRRDYSAVRILGIALIDGLTKSQAKRS